MLHRVLRKKLTDVSEVLTASIATLMEEAVSSVKLPSISDGQKPIPDRFTKIRFFTDFDFGTP
jgi:hypothetical protein